jgi:DNA mismatch repair protein MutS
MAREATIRGWVRPVVENRNRTAIVEGRHPIVEAHLARGEFIANDVFLDASETDDGAFFALITGPNMAGKSTYLRQAALITIMAQSGSFIPASEGHIGLVDRIYCRFGSQDNLAKGESTFLVEMNETAYILHTATKQSLVIMDEVGRGTGTEDGLSIAWAVCEELLNNIKCRTLFATHYHELAGIEHPAMVNRSMDVDERNGKIVFLRKIREGPTSESYGLHVAALAGLPEKVLKRAGEIMSLHKKEIPSYHNALLSQAETLKATPEYSESKVLKAEVLKANLLKELSELEIDAITPLEALNLMQQWKKNLCRIIAGDNKPASIQKNKNVIKPQDAEPSLFDP